MLDKSGIAQRMMHSMQKLFGNVRGQMSELVSEESVRQFLELRPDAKFVDVAKAGHMVAGDHNDAFTAAIADFLSHDLGWK